MGAATGAGPFDPRQGTRFTTTLTSRKVTLDGPADPVHGGGMADRTRRGPDRSRLAAAAAFAATLLVVSLPSSASNAAEPALPGELGGYSYLTGDVSDTAPGRAIALFQHGYGVEFLDFPQAVVLGAGGDVYRRLDVAEDRAGRETQGDPAPMLLSPDGLRVAVGDHDVSPADLAVVDLRTGVATRHALPEGRSVLPLGWSPDSQTVVYRTAAEPTNPHSGLAPRGGGAGLLDVSTGRIVSVPGGSDVLAAAFSPDGSEIALHRGGTRVQLEVVGLDGATRRVLDPEGGRLAGPAAWSPDGRFLAVSRAPDRIAFVDATGQGGEVPVPRSVEGDFLAWAAPDEVVVRVDTLPDPMSGGSEHAVITALPLDGGTPRQLMRMKRLEDYGVGGFQLAGGLVDDLRVVTPSHLDRGLWPWPLRIVLAFAAGLVVLVLSRIGPRVTRGFVATV